MRAVIQRVKKAQVRVEGGVRGAIGRGILVYIGVEKDDTGEDLQYISSKLRTLRIFEDSSGKMNLDIKTTGGEVLVISQFTLLGDLREGRRPSFDGAEETAKAKELYEALIEVLKEWTRVEEGEFQAHMEVESINDGPVTLLLDSRKNF